MAYQVTGIVLDTSELDRLMAELEGRAEEIISKAALQVEGVAKTLAPVDTGALMNSLQAERVGPLSWQVHDGVEYGIYQELGHHTKSGSFVPAHPFLTPAVESVREDFYRTMWQELFV